MCYCLFVKLASGNDVTGSTRWKLTIPKVSAPSADAKSSTSFPRITVFSNPPNVESVLTETVSVKVKATELAKNLVSGAIAPSVQDPGLAGGEIIVIHILQFQILFVRYIYSSECVSDIRTFLHFAQIFYFQLLTKERVVHVCNICLYEAEPLEYLQRNTLLSHNNSS